jgi:hypothetical protein
MAGKMQTTLMLLEEDTLAAHCQILEAMLNSAPRAVQ